MLSLPWKGGPIPNSLIAIVFVGNSMAAGALGFFLISRLREIRINARFMWGLRLSMELRILLPNYYTIRWPHRIASNTTGLTDGIISKIVSHRSRP